MSFPLHVSDHVYLAWYKGPGTVAVALDNYFFPLLDLRELSYNPSYNFEEAKHYVGVQFCNFLKNQTSECSILDDYWMKQYLSVSEIRKGLDIIQKNLKALRI